MDNVQAVLEPKAHAESPDIGLSDKYRKEMAGLLSDILASTYQLIIKNHIYHWNVVGPLFRSLHELTEEHYGELFEAADIIAERIRALGHLAPVKVGDASGFAPASSEVKNLTAHSMVEDLIQDHEDAVRTMRKAAEKAGEEGDIVTEDMLTARLTFHEKGLWMLRAIIAD